MSSSTPRVERDSLGELELPDSVYYGIQTARAIANFPVSGRRQPAVLIRAYVLVKKAAALVNIELGVLDKARGEAIVRAADDVLAGGLADHPETGMEPPSQTGHIGPDPSLCLCDFVVSSGLGPWADQFPVDAFQAGAGTSTNMNVNEVLANRALELLGRKRGDYAHLSPNDHVNMAQSSNDTFPTACHLAVMLSAQPLEAALAHLAAELRRKAGEFGSVRKTGRTHLMDALPVTLGNEFGAWASAVERAGERVAQRREDLAEIPIGGTAVGAGQNAHPRFRELVVRQLSELSGVTLVPCRDSFEGLQSRAQLAAFSGALRELALELIRIANDLRLLGSGPIAGLGEITLPAVQPGSSIMPGKVNPSLAECLDMVCFQIVGNDTAVALAAQAGQLELNVMTPLIIHNVLESEQLLAGFLPVFTDRCIAGIQADEAKCRSNAALNPALATLLVPRIGHMAAAELAKESLARRIPVPRLAIEKGIITEPDARALFGPDA